MKKRVIIGEFAALLLFTGGIMGSGAVLAGETEMLGAVGWGRVVISPVGSLFSRMEVERLLRELGGPHLCSLTPGLIRDVAAGYRSLQTRVIGTSPMYGQFHFLTFIQGSFFSDKAETGGEAVAVIGSRLAWDLFLTEQAAGVEFRIDGKTFRVVGVYRTGESLLDVMTDDGLPRIYVPITALDSEERGIETVQIAGVSRADVERALQAAGRQPSGTAVSDFETIHSSGMQKKALIVFMVSAAAAVILVVYIYGKTKTCAVSFCAEWRQTGLREAARKKAMDLIVCAGFLAAAAGILFVLWSLSRFRLQIPAEYFPDRLIDMDYYVGLVKELMREANALDSFIPPLETRITAAGSRIQNLLLAGGFIGGAVFLHVSVVHPRITFATLGVELFVSLALIVCLCLSLGFPPVTSIKDLYVVWIFCVLAATSTGARVNFE